MVHLYANRAAHLVKRPDDKLAQIVHDADFVKCKKGDKIKLKNGGYIF